MILLYIHFYIFTAGNLREDKKCNFRRLKERIRRSWSEYIRKNQAYQIVVELRIKINEKQIYI